MYLRTHSKILFLPIFTQIILVYVNERCQESDRDKCVILKLISIIINSSARVRNNLRSKQDSNDTYIKI